MVDDAFKLEKNIYDSNIRHAVSALSEATEASVAAEDDAKHSFADSVSPDFWSI